MTRSISDWGFALFSANLHQYLPHISWEAHRTIYSKWEKQHSGRIDPGTTLLLAEEQRFRQLPPGILLLFHLGHHLQLPIRLAEAGLLFDILLDREVYLRSQEVFDDLRSQMNDRGRAYEYLFSDDPSVLLRVRYRLQDRRHVLVFADGASGTRPDAKDGRVAIPFLEGEVRLKKGIPFMAYLYGLSLYPIMCGDSVDRPLYQLGKPIAPQKDENRTAFIYRALCECYTMLGDVLQKEPWRWECWSYMHANGMLQLEDADLESARRDDPILLLPLQERYCLFDRRYYQAQPLTFLQ